MLPIRFDAIDGKSLSVLCIGAHSDDIEIGCGGTLLKLAAMYSLDVTWVVLGASGDRRTEAENSARAFLAPAAQFDLHFTEFPNSYFPYDGRAIKDQFENIKRKCSPDVVFTHFRDDLHQDHRLVGELTWNTFRNHVILEYEIPKYDGGLGSPNVFLTLDRATCERKIAFIMEHFKSQTARSWFSEETFWALLRLRGIECNSPTGYAEAHYSRKLLL